jgi:hypothetical protein
MVTVDSGKEFSVEARGAFDDVDDISGTLVPVASLRQLTVADLPTPPLGGA